MPGKLRVTLVKSPISHNPAHARDRQCLGLHRIGETVEIDDTPAVRGMIRAVRFLVNRRRGDPDSAPREPRDRQPAPRRRQAMKLHDLKPAAGLAPAAHARRPRHRRRQGQDRRPRHQGPEVARRRARSRPGSKAARRRSTSACPSCTASRTASRIEYAVVNVGQISAYAEAGRFGVEASSPRARARHRPAGLPSTPRCCASAGLIRGDDKPLKVLGQGEVSRQAVRRRRGVQRQRTRARSRPPAASSSSWPSRSRRASRRRPTRAETHRAEGPAGEAPAAAEAARAGDRRRQAPAEPERRRSAPDAEPRSGPAAKPRRRAAKSDENA